MSNVSCPCLNEEFKTVLHCAAECFRNYYCNGFVWSPDTRQCFLIYLVTINTSWKRTLSLCSRDTQTTASPYHPVKTVSFCTWRQRLWGTFQTDDVLVWEGFWPTRIKNNTVLEMKKIVYDFFLRQNMDPCIKYSPTNVQCYLVIVAETIGSENLLQQNVSLSSMMGMFDIISKNTCNSFFSITIWLDEDTSLVDLKCTIPSLLFYCQFVNVNFLSNETRKNSHKGTFWEQFEFLEKYLIFLTTIFFISVEPKAVLLLKRECCVSLSREIWSRIGTKVLSGAKWYSFKNMRTGYKQRNILVDKIWYDSKINKYWKCPR